MQSLKEEIKQLIDELPDDATLDDIEYHLYVRRKIERSLKAVKEGQFISHEEATKKMRSWQEK